MGNKLEDNKQAKLGSLFLNAKETKKYQLTLKELGHNKLVTPIISDNTTGLGIVNNTIKKQRSRAMEIQ
eukprot:6111239-Ditylum_brightwellii.AAC.1